MTGSRTIQVKGKQIGPGAPIFLTAEIGAAHVGRFEDCKRMMRAAAEAGCDGADVFMASAEDFYHNGGWGDSDKDSRDIWRAQSFTLDQWRALFAYADEIGLVLYPTPLDTVSIEWCRELKSPMINLNSDDINNIPLLAQAASLGVPVTFHDINASLAEVEAAVRTLLDHGCRDIIVLHSTSESGEEETLYASANLEVMNTYRQAFGGLGVQAGCVEHTTSDFLIYAVAALRPALISKHILLYHEEGLPDNNISVDIDHLGAMVRKVRYVEMALGMGANQAVVSADGSLSLGNRGRRKVLVAARDLPAGHRVGPGDLTAKRPGHLGGLSPTHYRLFVGAVTAAPLARNQIIDLNQFQEFAAIDYKFPGVEPYVVQSADKAKGA